MIRVLSLSSGVHSWFSQSKVSGKRLANSMREMNSSESKLHSPVFQSTKLERFIVQMLENTSFLVVPRLKSSQPSGIWSSAANMSS